MRVITGSRRGRKLKTLDSFDTRPTTEMVKEAVFSAIQFDIPGANVLDLFAGSGQMGIEALSRDASHCVFVDSNPAAAEIVRANVAACEFTDKSNVFMRDSIDYLIKTKGGFDIVFLDPPYGSGLIEKSLDHLDGKLNAGAFVVCEHEKELGLPDEWGSLKLHKRYRYGKISVTVYQLPEEEEA